MAVTCNLEVRGLSVTVSEAGQRNRRTILNIPYLDLPGGSTLALSGASGSGKSTFLSVLAGLEDLWPGQVRWGETDLGALKEHERDEWRRLRLSMVFQDFHLIPGLSALENALIHYDFGPYPEPKSALRHRAMHWLDRLGLADRKGPVASLSRGEMQRVALCRALAKQPAILLADEPSASLDAESEEEILALLPELCAEQGATLILATHHKGFVAGCTHRITLSHGQVQGQEALP